MNKTWCIIGTLVLSINSLPSAAEVFKCETASGAVDYQATPCLTPQTRQQVLPMKLPSPQEVASVRQKLKRWREQQAANEKTKQEAKKELLIEKNKQQFLDAQQRIANAEEQQALAAQRLAGEREYQNRLNRYNSLYVNRHYSESSLDQDEAHRFRHGHEGRHPRQHNEAVPHAKELGDYGAYRPAGSLGSGLGEYPKHRLENTTPPGLDTDSPMTIHSQE